MKQSTLENLSMSILAFALLTFFYVLLTQMIACEIKTKCLQGSYGDKGHQRSAVECGL